MTRGNTLYAAALLAALALSACSSDDDGPPPGPSLPNHRTGPLASLPAVGAAKTLQAGTADTHEVETDGTWIVWKGRQINLSLSDGGAPAVLDLALPGSVTPWAFSDCARSPMAFDGATLVFVADDVADAAPPAFWFARPGQAARKVDMPFATSRELVDYGVHVFGDVAGVYAMADGELRVLDLSAASPAFGENLLPETGMVEQPGRNLLPVLQPGHLDLLDLATGTTATLTGDDNEGTGVSELRFASGKFTWTENGQAYVFDAAGGATDSAPIAGTPEWKSGPVAGPGYFLWNEGGDLKYLAAGSTTVEDVGVDVSTSSLVAGAGFLAWIGDDAAWADQLFVYDLSDRAATAAAQVTAFEGSDQPSAGHNLQVDGAKVYAVFDFESLHVPSKVLVSYDFATETLAELTSKDDWQVVPLVRAAAGKVAFLHRDHSFRLFAKAAGAAGAPVALTKPGLRVNSFAIADGLLAFTALDRDTWPPELLEYLSGDQLIEVYALDLDGARALLRLTSNMSEDDAVQTDGRFVTWYDNDNYVGWAHDTTTGAAKPFAFDVSSKLPVDGGIAVWRDGSTIQYYDLATDASGEIYSGSDVQKCPSIADGVVAWNDGMTVMYYDLGAAEPAVTTVEGSHAAYVQAYYWGTYWYQAPVATDGRYLAWVDSRDAFDHDGDEGTAAIAANVVVVHDTETGVTRDLPAADWTQTGTEVDAYEDGSAGAVCNPRVSGGVVAFAAIEYGQDNPDGDKEIFVSDVRAASPSVVRLTSDAEGSALWDSRPEIANGVVVWRTGDGGASREGNGKSPAAARVP